MAAVQLLVRRWCHLCDEMEAAVRPLLARAGMSLELVDVDEDPLLEARYGTDVPVLRHAGEVICRHRPDTTAVQVWIAKNC